jgi:hypothetical protein
MSVQVTPDDDIMDFTPKRKIPRFRIGDDIFTGVAEIPAELSLDFAQKAALMGQEGQTTAEKLAVIRELISVVLMPESAAIFIARLSDSANPIGINSFRDVLPWLLKQYMGTPTTPDSDSSSGPGNQESGKNSTENTSDEE